MDKLRSFSIPLLMAFLLLVGIAPSDAAVNVQCPGGPNTVCMHLSGGDGYVTMADGRVQYMFSFADITGVPDNKAMEEGMLAATFPAPTIVLDEGDEFYLNLTNVGMVIRPDLFDPHTIHWHGFPEAASIFDGVPDSSISINMGTTLTYYYNVVEPGTYMYHCHVEATEHMQMGMLGNLYVRPAQNKLANGTDLSGFTHQKGFMYAYNDGDGSTYYDVEYPIQIGSFDPDFHDASETVQPLPFAMMKDKYSMLNGRGYPDTVNPNPLPAPAENGGKVSQEISALIEADQGDKILLRISNLNVTRYDTLATLGIPMKVIGKDAKLLRGPTGKDLYYEANSVTLGGGEAVDVILDTANVAPGTYFLYTTNLNHLTNYEEDFGGAMTEIVIN
jgi:FtsP/CotA-like multicopper oxidase with cupredoxin domain